MRRHVFESWTRTTSHYRKPARKLLAESLEDRRVLAVFAVTNTSDSGPGSFRDAVEMANQLPGDDSVEIQLSNFNDPIFLTSGPVEVTESLEISTIGEQPATISGLMQAGTDAFGDGQPILVIAGSSATVVNVSNLVFEDADGSGSGAAIEATGHLGLHDVIIQSNRGVFTSAAVHVEGQLDISNSQFLDNTLALQFESTGGESSITGTVFGAGANRFRGLANGGAALAITDTQFGEDVEWNGAGESSLLVSDSTIKDISVVSSESAGIQIVDSEVVDSPSFVANDTSSIGIDGVEFTVFLFRIVTDGDAILTMSNSTVSSGFIGVDTRVSGNSTVRFDSSEFTPSEPFPSVAVRTRLFDGGRMEVNNSLFHSALTGLEIRGEGSALVENSEFRSNTTGLTLGVGDATIRTSIFEENGLGFDVTQFGGEFEITDVTMTNNTGNGGSVLAFGSTASTGTIDGIETTGNGATGLSVSSSRTDLTINDVIAMENGNGGVVISASGNAVASAIQAINNQQGGITIFGSGVHLTDSVITGNVGENGGGLSASAYVGAIQVSNTRIEGNTATGSGGGAWLYATAEGEVRLENTEVTGNVANRNGGGVAGYAAFTGAMTISDSVIQGNELTDVAASGDGAGGGLFLDAKWNSSHTITGSRIVENVSPNKGGGVAAIANSLSQIEVRDSELTGNTSGTTGGGAYVDASEYSTAFVVESEINDNVALQAGGLSISQSIFSESTVERSVIAGNVATARGGGVSLGGDATVMNSRIEGNTSVEAAAIDSVDGIVTGSTMTGNVASGAGAGVVSVRDSGTLSLLNSTISGNEGGVVLPVGDVGFNWVKLFGSTIVDNTGFGLDTGSSTAFVENSVLANNSLGDLEGSASVSYSLVERGDLTFGSNNILGRDPRISPLGNHGGFTQTHRILAGSPLIDAGRDSLFLRQIGTDQRGAPFGRTVGVAMDIGAFEFQDDSLSDFNADGSWNCADIDALTMQVASGEYSSQYDVNQDGLVDIADVEAWLAIAGSWNLDSGQPHLVGDANLDGVVDVQDFNVWNANKFTASSWCGGDFNADGAADVSDFNKWSENRSFATADVVLDTVAELRDADDERASSRRVIDAALQDWRE